VLGRLVQGVVIFLGLLIALVIALPTFKPAQLVEFLGLSSVAIGFAFRDILQNFLAGVLLLWNEPFRTDDFAFVFTHLDLVADAVCGARSVGGCPSARLSRSSRK